jgi:hypothetical protein
MPKNQMFKSDPRNVQLDPIRENGLYPESRGHLGYDYHTPSPIK